MVNVGIPKIFLPLAKPSRFKVCYGGRGSGKSVNIARLLLLKGAQQKLFILCAREIQKSVKNSVHKLLSDQIELLGLQSFYEIQNTEINGLNGTQFIFEGLFSNQAKIKSMQGVHICWVEEAENISCESWDLLVPTVREDNVIEKTGIPNSDIFIDESEIWVSFNPQRDDDETYKRFITNKKENCILLEVNHSDNPHFPEVLRKEMEECKKKEYTKYLHIWEGKPITNYDSLVYRWDDAINESKTKIPYNPLLSTYVSWDFGTRDDTAIIWWQVEKVPLSERHKNGVKITIIDEYIANGKDPNHYRAIVNSKPYNVEMHYCDPSGANRESDLSSWVDRLGFNFDYTSKYSIAEQVDRANEYMTAVTINREQCPKVFKMFRSWQWKTDNQGRLMLPPKPVHDEFSHAGTSWYYGIINRFPTKKKGGNVYVY
jgi:phage terminase large subunit